MQQGNFCFSGRLTCSSIVCVPYSACGSGFGWRENKPFFGSPSGSPFLAAPCATSISVPSFQGIFSVYFPDVMFMFDCSANVCRSDSGGASFLIEFWAAVKECAASSNWNVVSIPQVVQV